MDGKDQVVLGDVASAGGVDHAVDQVRRRQAFERDHPDWRIGFDEASGLWRATRLIDGGSDKLSRYLLRDLLDALEARS